MGTSGGEFDVCNLMDEKMALLDMVNTVNTTLTAIGTDGTFST